MSQAQPWLDSYGQMSSPSIPQSKKGKNKLKQKNGADKVTVKLRQIQLTTDIAPAVQSSPPEDVRPSYNASKTSPSVPVAISEVLTLVPAAAKKKKHRKKENQKRSDKGSIAPAGAAQAEIKPNFVKNDVHAGKFAGVKKALFSEHLSQREIELGLQDGSLVQGTLAVNPKMWKEAYVRIEGKDDVFVDGIQDRNRAMEGDVVAVRLLPTSHNRRMSSTACRRHSVLSTGATPAKMENTRGVATGVMEPAGALTSSEVPRSPACSTEQICDGRAEPTAQGCRTELSTCDGESVSPAPLDLAEVSSGRAILAVPLSSRNVPQEGVGEAVVGATEQVRAPECIAPHRELVALPSLEAAKASSAPAELAVPTSSNLPQEVSRAAAVGAGEPGCTTISNVIDGGSPVLAPMDPAEDPGSLASMAVPSSVDFPQEGNGAAEVEGKGEGLAQRDTLRAGVVVGILRRKEHSTYTGTVKACNQEGFRPHDRYALFVPSNTRVPRFLVRLDMLPEDFTKRSEHYASWLFACSFLDWPASSSFPLGMIVASLGPSGQISVETDALLREHDIDSRPFSKDVLDCVAPADWSIPEDETLRRRDLRSERVFTIDPITAKDLDDALHIRQLDDATYEVGVHIADVSFFVPESSALDREAEKRATTVYLVDRAIPMLPKTLCDHLCSLNPAQDRLAFSVIWKMTDDGIVLDRWFGRTIIRSCCKMDYQRAQAMIDATSAKHVASPPDGSDLDVEKPHSLEECAEDVRKLHMLASKLRASRLKNGAVELNNVKLRFCLDADGFPTSCSEYPFSESNRLVQEFMLLANMAVAEKIASSFPRAALLRRHPPPLSNKLAEIRDELAESGIHIDPTSSQSLQESLQRYADSHSPELVLAVHRIVTRSMTLARYFCSGDASLSLKSHYALSVPLYTHFTSPIRRYADVLVHRLLSAAVDPQGKVVSEDVSSVKRISSVASHCNLKKQNAKLASEHSDHVYLCALLRRAPMLVTAVVLYVLDRAFDLFVPSLGIHRRVRLDDLQIESSHWSPEARTLEVVWPIGKRQTFARLDVIQAEVAVQGDCLPIDLSVRPICPS